MTVGLSNLTYSVSLAVTFHCFILVLNGLCSLNTILSKSATLGLRTSRGGKSTASVGSFQLVVTLLKQLSLISSLNLFGSSFLPVILFMTLTARLKSPSAPAIFSTVPIDFCPHLLLLLI